MHLARHRRASSLLTSRLLLLLALGVASVALTQCRSVTDRINGIEVSVYKAKTCLDLCETAAANRTKDEEKRHRDNLKECNGNASCVAQENARHQAELQAIEAALIACRNSCHEQGSGSVGP